MSQPTLPHQSPHRTIGTVNCASSTCHGSVAPWAGGTILRNEYSTWLREDKHTRAYAVLDNAVSRRMVRNLGLSGPASAAKICLDCHAHNPPQDLRGPRFVQSEGIGCEGCHGPAEIWIGPHTDAGATTENNVANGMYPSHRPRDLARLCLSCHFGDDTRMVTHRLMGAGHPRLSFELKTFTTLAPAHYAIDADYVRRKGNYDPVRLWAIGQAIAAQLQLDTLTDPERGRAGLFPELVVFDCHACHRPMSAARWSPRLGIGPGRVRLDDSHLLMLRAIVRAVEPDQAAAFEADVAAVHAAIAGDSPGHGAAALQRVAQLSRRIAAYPSRWEQTAFPPTVQRRILGELVEQALSASYADYAGAEQAYMAIVTLANDLVANGALRNSAALQGALAALLASLADDEAYRPQPFNRELAQLRELIAAEVES
ncbi:MAG: multiheme c-type cytochrome [Gammaproteobacteria bacterium]